MVYQGTNYEVTTFRAEAEYVDHRRPSEVYFVRDLKKIYNVVTLQLMQLPWINIYDYFEGDVALNQHIKTVGDAKERFKRMHYAF